MVPWQSNVESLHGIIANQWATKLGLSQILNTPLMTTVQMVAQSTNMICHISIIGVCNMFVQVSLIPIKESKYQFRTGRYLASPIFKTCDMTWNSER